MIFVYVILEFICGSLMFSYWLGLSVKKDLSTIGDGNPGAANLWHAAGYKMGLLGVLLDVMKGYIPLVFLIESGLIKGFEIVPVAIAPILGHAFSPFVKGKGGKAIAVTFGVWSAVTRFEGSIVYAIILAIIQVVVKYFKKGKPISSDIDGLMVVAGMWLLGAYLFFMTSPTYLLYLWIGNLAVLTYTNRFKLLRVLKSAYNKYQLRHTKTV